MWGQNDHVLEKNLAHGVMKLKLKENETTLLPDWKKKQFWKNIYSLVSFFNHSARQRHKIYRFNPKPKAP